MIHPDFGKRSLRTHRFDPGRRRGVEIWISGILGLFVSVMPQWDRARAKVSVSSRLYHRRIHRLVIYIHHNLVCMYASPRPPTVFVDNLSSQAMRARMIGDGARCGDQRQ